VLHLHNGDAARAVLERSGLVGEHAVFAEALHEGPVRGLLPREVWRADRVAFYRTLESVTPGLPEPGALLERWDRDLARSGDFDEVVLWLEHDLFDQLLLIHHLAHFSRTPRGATKLSLVCIDRHPEVERFLGLGQLRPEAMAALFEERVTIGEPELALGLEAWRAFCAAEPRGISLLLTEDTCALPFLAPALGRFCQEYPGKDGLARSERQVLAALAGGSVAGSDLFRAAQGSEESPFMGDLLFWALVAPLAEAPHPLLGVDVRDAAWPERTLHLTSAGRDVLGGRTDAVALRGIDRWRGGVHLGGGDPVWRWDDAEGFRC